MYSKDNGNNEILLSIKDYLQYLKCLNYCERTIQHYKIALNKFSSYLAANHVHRLNDVSLKDLDDYRLVLVDDDFADTSIVSYLRQVQNFFHYLEQKQEVFMDPSTGLRIPKASYTPQPVPSEKEVKKLLDQPAIPNPVGIRDRAIMETFYSSGVRLEELVRMNVPDVDMKRGVVKVVGKGSKERVTPVGKHAVSWIEKYLAKVRPQFLKERQDEKALWLGEKGKRINPLIVERSVRKYAQEAGVSPVTPHALRRACATHMLQGGAHPVQIQMLLGHSTLRTLSHYLKITITEMFKTHKKGKPGR
ncbi:MAG: tyrosine-type recombinase/integrase [bacterium]